MQDTTNSDDTPEPLPLGKYPLNDTWVLKYKPKYQYKKQQSETDWLDSFLKMHEKINCIGTFWSVFNNIPSWYDLHSGTIYAFFKNGINPSWEDKMNEKGCSYTFYFNRAKMNQLEMNQVYIECLLFLIGNMSDYHQFLNGVTFERKYKGDKLIIWCSAHSNEMFHCVIDNIFPQSVKDYLTLKQFDLSDSRYKVFGKVVDHQSELKRLNHD